MFLSFRSNAKFTGGGNKLYQWLMLKYFLKAKLSKNASVSSRPSETTGSVPV